MESSAEEHKKKGNEAFKNADWDLAIKEYNKAISLDNKQPAYFSNRAACWSSKGNHESALADASRCLELDPAFVKGYSRKGKALFDLSRLDEAEEAYKAGLEVEATHQGCSQGLADVKAARAQANASAGSTSGLGSAFSNSASKLLEKLKQGGLGGRLQMYMVAFAGYYLYKNYMGNPTRETETEKVSASEPDFEVGFSAPAGGMSLQRGFEQARGHWSSFLESRDGEKTSLVFLHRTASSAEAEFAKVLPEVKKVLLISPGVAADQPSLGDFEQWLKRQRKSPRSLADAVKWAASVLENEVQVGDDTDTDGMPEGCSVTVLTEAGDTEDKVFLEELEGQGHVVRSRQLLPQDSLHEEVAKEALQLLA